MIKDSMAALKDNKKSTTTVIFDFFGVLIDENSQKPIAHTALFLEHCAAKELPIYLLTNALPHKLAMYADIHPALFAHFTAIITPQEAGYKKPDPRIFLYAINQFTLIPETTLFLDDTQDNIASARTVGLHAVWYSQHVLLDQLLIK